ncbi:hypothetical protein [Bosea sp. (in: a-proteobacteria)]|uniref:hypothetical protein n=1 Tax=Bosea sp. (in: a-proteobacteria) TaxID=1871050 RepID=UPI001ACCA0D1|nr:hypothetical protein [Bosea sp. (in: a-proteobacteria)]MBN9439365.1 hypothetical protein [Bosea sp. (in: a-proteobacteria)]
MTTVPATRKKRTASSPSRKYLAPELMKSAFLAGQGYTAADIALQIGGTTGAKIASQLHRYGVSLPRRGDDEIMQIRWSRRDQAALDALAENRSRGAPDLVVIILRILLAEPVLFNNLLDEVEMIEDARHGPSRPAESVGASDA